MSGPTDDLASPPAELPPGRASAEPTFPVWYEHTIRPYVDRFELLPVVLAVLGHLVVALAPLMLFVARDGSIGSAVALAVLAAPCVAFARAETRALGRPGRLTLMLGLTWLVAVGVAFACGEMNVL